MIAVPSDAASTVAPEPPPTIYLTVALPPDHFGERCADLKLVVTESSVMGVPMVDVAIENTGESKVVVPHLNSGVAFLSKSNHGPPAPPGTVCFREDSELGGDIATEVPPRGRLRLQTSAVEEPGVWRFAYFVDARYARTPHEGGGVLPKTPCRVETRLALRGAGAKGYQAR